MKTDKFIKYSIWSLLGAVAVIILAFLNIANDSNKIIASYPEGSVFNEGVGYIAFFSQLLFSLYRGLYYLVSSTELTSVSNK